MWLLVVLACSDNTAPVGEPAPEAAPVGVEAAPKPGPAASSEQAVKFHMKEHLAHADRARSSLVGGDWESARANLAWLSEDHLVDGLPEGSEPFVSAFRDAARKGAEADTSVGVSVAIGELGATCGSCHLAYKTGPVIDFGAAPDPEEGSPAHMALHQYALTAMWASIVAGDDYDAWTRGTGILAKTHELTAADFGVAELSPDATQRAANVHEIAAAAQGERDEAKRAEAFSAILMGCVGCHQEMRGE